MISESHRTHILKKDVWHELEIKAVLNADSSIYDLLRASITAKTLTPICTVQIAADGASVYGFNATDVIEWARLKGFSIPAEVAALANIKPIEPESQAEAVEKLSLDNEWDAIFDTMPDIFNGLKNRNEAPYDGVLGTPPSSVTVSELERFESIRNRLIDGEGYTEIDIRGLINDCNANTHSFSLIPDRLKQDIRFLASLWRAAEQNKPKTEAAGDEVRAEKENGNQRNERELKQGLREIWVNEGRPEMKAFFPDKLKKYINQSGSPITAVYTAGKDAGFAFKLSTGTTGNRKKKTLSNYVSEFKNTP